MSLRKFLFLPVTLLALNFAVAEGTRTWEQSRYEDFTRGTPHGVAISSDGSLELAPAMKLLASTPSNAVWALALGPHEETFAATGAPARVYQITAGGQPTAIFQPQELQVQALAVDKSGAIYAATNPDGKVYKLERKTSIAEAKGEKNAAAGEWNSSVYFNPKTKYIWALAVDPTGNLYVATGDHGEIFRVTPGGEHSVFFKSDDPHIRVLTLARNGDVIAGSDGSGLIYRISPHGEGFVLYSAAKKEITSLALDGEGNIYAAAAGEKKSGGPPNVTINLPSATPPGGVNDKSQPAQAGPSDTTVVLNNSTSGVPGGSEIYRIAPDGSPTRMWNSRDQLVYALAFNNDGHLLAGTGNRGEILEILGREDYSELLKAAANQVTALVASGNGLYASTSNLGKVFLVGNSAASEADYESDVFDARVFSKWGRAEFRGKGNVELFARSGNVDNPDRNWSPWKRVDIQKDAEITAPAARFVQWKAILRPGAVAPRVDSVTLNYLPRNVAPEFDEVLVVPGTRYQAVPRPPNTDLGQRFDPQPTAMRDRQSVGVKWTVRDDNDDQMTYSVYYRPDGQSRWLLLKNNLSDKFYSFDAALLPDGGYTVKVVASDSPSHSPQDALSSERESSPFEVDTTPPLIQDLRAAVQGNKVRVQFRAEDGFSPIKRAEYSLDAGDWHFVEPVGQLSDSKTESYDFALPLSADAAGQEHIVVVRAYDRYDNMNSAKTLVAGK
jgi:hypothetical protein